ncbi:MAG: DUF1232 domain-containing protein [Gammaproteobacteria bacterium]|nr:DUF1232 domain-containing protein [Gammaproteobacteria bacterium]
MKLLRQWARQLKVQTLTVYCLARDPATAWWLRLLAVAVAAYALSPVDLIPDFIPVVGLLDDLLLVPLGVWLVLRCAPDETVARARARATSLAERPTSVGGAAFIVTVWVVLLLWLVSLVAG